MFKARFRLPLSALHHRLLQYLGLPITQISPNAWRIFISAKVLYRVLSKEKPSPNSGKAIPLLSSVEDIQVEGYLQFPSKETSAEAGVRDPRL